MPISNKATRENVEEQHKLLDGLALPRWLPADEPADRGHVRSVRSAFCARCGLAVPFWIKTPCPAWSGNRVTLGVEGRIAVLLTRIKGISPETLTWLMRKVHELRKGRA